MMIKTVINKNEYDYKKFEKEISPPLIGEANEKINRER